jgi:CDP-diacylglycerol--serine O-phosphatidyltransferase
MSRDGLASYVRFALPQVFTGVRALMGLYLIFLVAQRHLYIAVVIWMFGLLTDVADGVLARRLGDCSQFGHIFDLIADYIYHVLVPAVMSLFLIGENAGTPSLLLLSLPSPFAALRYARKAGLSETEYPGIPASPGLGTISYGLYVAALVFFRREGMVETRTLAWLLLVGTPVLSILMAARVRYPKLGVYPWVLYPILAGLMIMPFFQTTILLWVMMGLIVAYVCLSPLLIDQHPERAGRRAAAPGNHRVGAPAGGASA